VLPQATNGRNMKAALVCVVVLAALAGEHQGAAEKDWLT
jgi:hypothetical protein